jgi:hypothetical protein
MEFTDGDLCPGNKPRAARVDFICNLGEGIGIPQYQSEDSPCEYTFVWETSVACPRSQLAADCLAEDGTDGTLYNLTALINPGGYTIQGTTGQETYNFTLGVCQPLPGGCGTGAPLPRSPHPLLAPRPGSRHRADTHRFPCCGNLALDQSDKVMACQAKLDASNHFTLGLGPAGPEVVNGVLQVGLRRTHPGRLGRRWLILVGQFGQFGAPFSWSICTEKSAKGRPTTSAEP